MSQSLSYWQEMLLAWWRWGEEERGPARRENGWTWSLDGAGREWRVAVREEGPRPSGRWLRYLRSHGQGTRLAEDGQELDLDMSSVCLCDSHVGRLSRQLDLWAWS